MSTHARFALRLLALLVLPALAWGQSPGILINEFLASNQTTNKDPDWGEFSDWIEFYNPSREAADLSGYYVTDDLDEPRKGQIPPGTWIPGAGFLLLGADGRDAHQGSFFLPPSPGSGHDPRGRVAVTPPPVFSLTGGFYHGAQVLGFENSDQIEIYDALDGKPPDDSAWRYRAPLTLAATTAVRAIGYRRGFAPSEVVTHTYFIDEAVHLPFVSIVTDPANFFSNDRGIYVTGTNGTSGYCDSAIRNVKQDWERPVNVELYEGEGTLAFNQQAGVKIYGGCSRTRFPQKSLALFARQAYGKGSFAYQLFPDKDIGRFESFILRSSADDQIYTLFRDALSQSVLVEYRDVDVQAYRPAVLFLNGRYWGIHNIREKINEHYVAGNFGIDAKEVNLLEGVCWDSSISSRSGSRPRFRGTSPAGGDKRILMPWRPG